MAAIRIHRSHRLGLPKAREVAWQWAEEVERRFDMSCTVIEGSEGDTVEFQRSGVDGRLLVRAAHFDLEARLGFLLSAFSTRIEAEIERNLDELLASHAQPKAASTAAAATRGVRREPRVTETRRPTKVDAPSDRARKPAAAKRRSPK